MAGNGDQALRLVRLLMDGGTAGPYLLTMIARQFRQFLLVRDMQRHGVERQEMARRLEIRSDFVLGRAASNSPGATPTPGSRPGLRRVLEADLNVKRGIQEEDMAVELLVAEIAGLG